MIMLQKDENGAINCIMTGKVVSNPEVSVDKKGKNRAFFWVEYAVARTRDGKGYTPVKCLCVTYYPRLFDIIRTLKRNEQVRLHGIMLENKEKTMKSGLLERYLSVQTIECSDRLHEMQIQHIRERIYNRQISGLVDAAEGVVFDHKHDTGF